MFPTSMYVLHQEMYAAGVETFNHYDTLLFHPDHQINSKFTPERCP